MPQHTTPRQQAKPLRGREVIEEAARLLQQLQFAVNRGAYADGQHVAVSVDPRRNDDNATLRVLFTCCALGHRRVDWEGVPVIVWSEDRQEEGGRTFLNARGQAILPTLPVGQYRAVLDIPTRVGLPAQRGLALAGAGLQEQESALPISQWSEDGRVLCTLYCNDQSQVVIEFRSTVAVLQDGSVRLTLTSRQTREAILSHLVPLQPDAKGILTGRLILSEVADLGQEYEIAFAPVEPKTD